MKFRNEVKHEISYGDFLVLRQRISQVAMPDIHGNNGHYRIRSLYFDDSLDTALMEKINGIGIREKFRLRYYDDDTSYIRLEKKSKINGLCQKEWAILNAEETKKILKKETEWMPESEEKLLREFYLKMKLKGLQPKGLLEYERDAFVFPAGNVRVTLDYHIRAGSSPLEFMRADTLFLPVVGDPIILEVKWDEFLPGIIRDALMLEGRGSCAYSKYAACRFYG